LDDTHNGAKSRDSTKELGRHSDLTAEQLDEAPRTKSGALYDRADANRACLRLKGIHCIAHGRMAPRLTANQLREKKALENRELRRRALSLEQLLAKYESVAPPQSFQRDAEIL